LLLDDASSCEAERAVELSFAFWRGARLTFTLRGAGEEENEKSVTTEVVLIASGVEARSENSGRR
jgi:hypothetical protein